MTWSPDGSMHEAPDGTFDEAIRNKSNTNKSWFHSIKIGLHFILQYVHFQCFIPNKGLGED